MREIILYEARGEAKHMACGYAGSAVGKHLDIFAENKAIASYDLTGMRIPHYKLTAWHRHCVEFIYIAFKPCASSRIPERDLAQASYFTHNVGTRVGISDIYLIITLVGMAQ